MKEYPFIYSLKVWITALLISAITMSIIWREPGMIFLTLVVGVVVSLPAFLLFYALSNFVFNQDWTVLKKKIILAAGLNFIMGIVLIVLVYKAVHDGEIGLALCIFPAVNIAVFLHKSE